MSLLLAGAVAGGVMGKMKGGKASRLAEREADLRWMATQEQVRKMELQHNEILGQARADVGASGFTSGSTSHSGAITEAEGEFQRERDLTLMVGKEMQDIGIYQAGQMGDQMTTTGIISGFGLGNTARKWFG